MRFLIFLTLVILLAFPPTARAAPAGTTPARAAVASEAVVMPPVTARMRHYAHTRYALYFLGTAWGALALWGVLASGLSARLRDWAAPLRFGPLRLLGYYALLSLALLLLQLPLTVYSGWWLEHAYGLSHQPFPDWVGDVLKARGVNALIRVPIFLLLFGLIARSPRRWALWFWAALIPIVAFGIFLAPVLTDPLFNRFTPLPPGLLRTQIRSLAAKAGIPDAPIYVMDASRQTETTNAYVTGLGASARIVIWDTTLRKMPPDEVVAIVGHEVGHYVLHHIYWGFALGVGALLVVLPLAQKGIEFTVQRFGPRWRLRGLTDPAAIPVYLLTLLLVLFLTDPLVNAVSRTIEHQADAYGLRVTGDRLAMARVFVFFATQDLDDPTPPPFIKFWLYDHPPLQERLDFALGHTAR